MGGSENINPHDIGDGERLSTHVLSIHPLLLLMSLDVWIGSWDEILIIQQH